MWLWGQELLLSLIHISSLDKLNDRAVKYNLDNNGDVDKTKVTYEGPTYANKTGGTHVTNVAYATGNDGSEAVNVDVYKRQEQHHSY